jgi:hypothetical protein
VDDFPVFQRQFALVKDRTQQLFQSEYFGSALTVFLECEASKLISKILSVAKYALR